MGDRNGDDETTATQPVLTLVFAMGERPAMAAVEAVGASPGAGPAFAIAAAAAGEDHAQLVAEAQGLVCRGLAPGRAAELPPHGTRVGLSRWPAGEALTLEPGGDALEPLPLLRVLAGVAARIGTLPGIAALSWAPAGSWVEPELFRKSIAGWLGGDDFPVETLTLVRRESNGGFVSRGLHYLIGQELRLEPDRGVAPEAGAAAAAELVRRLVADGGCQDDCDFVLADGATYLAVPTRGGRELRVMRRRER